MAGRKRPSAGLFYLHAQRVYAAGGSGLAARGKLTNQKWNTMPVETLTLFWFKLPVPISLNLVRR